MLRPLSLLVKTRLSSISHRDFTNIVQGRCPDTLRCIGNFSLTPNKQGGEEMANSNSLLQWDFNTFLA